VLPALARDGFSDDLMLVIAEEDHEWHGLLAVARDRVSHNIPLTALTTNSLLFSWYVGRQHPLVTAERTRDALAALLTGRQRIGLSGIVEIRNFPATGPLAAGLGELEREGTLTVLERAAHTLAWAEPRPPSEVQESAPRRIITANVDPEFLGAGTRRELRRRARRLVDAAGGGDLVLHDASDDPNAIERFLALQMSGWKADPDRGGAAVLLDAGRERFFREVIDGFASTGGLSALELWAGKTHVHSYISLISGGMVAGFVDSYQDEFSHFRPGEIGRAAVCAQLVTQPECRAFDPGLPDAYVVSAKNYPDRREFRDLLIGSGLFSSRVVGVLPRAERSSITADGLSRLNGARRRVRRVLRGS
jgi:hypothetical protein